MHITSSQAAHPVETCFDQPNRKPFISPEGVVENADKVHGEQHKGIQVQQPGQKPAAALCPGCG